MAFPVASSRNWQQVASEAQQYRDASIAKVEPSVPEVPQDLPLNVTSIPKQLLSEQEVNITTTAPEDLLKSLAEGRVTSHAVTTAFLRRAGLSQKLVNCITELVPERALERAKFLDDYLASHGKPYGPLHGLPISVKEHIAMKGLTLNAAFICFHDHVAEDDAHMLQILWNAGAVFYARTTQPQTLMHLETSSNYFGVTVNPFNRNLTSGGSSGGEGALLGLRGSCLGIGSPAANNGVYGIRPTSYRLPLLGGFATMLGADHIVPVQGPLSTSISGISLFMKTIIDAKPWLTEPSILPIPWTPTPIQPSPSRPLKIALMPTDNVVHPHPPITRALHEVAERLRALPNVTIVPWTPYKHDYAWSILASLYFADGAAEERAALSASGEPWRPLSGHILENEWVKALSIEELWTWQIRREEYRAEYAQLWNETGKVRQRTGDGDGDGDGGVGTTEEREGTVDAILCPVGPGVAPLLNTSKWWGYTSQWNLLDYPAMTFPVSKVDQEKDKKQDGYEPLSERDRENWELYEPERYKDAPISLQLVGRRYEDEKVVSIVEYITKALELPWAQYV